MLINVGGEGKLLWNEAAEKKMEGHAIDLMYEAPRRVVRYRWIKEMFEDGPAFPQRRRDESLL